MKDGYSSEDERDLLHSRTLSDDPRPIRKERRPALISLRGELPAVPIPLERPRVTLGRAFEANVRINDSRASRLHARITTETDPNSGNPIFRIVDLASTNGTIVNGEPVNEAVLSAGDEIEIGDHSFRFELLGEIDEELEVPINRLIGHDEFTGLLTAKSFFSELRREVDRAEAESRPFCVLMMSLDSFQEVNDSLGHSAVITALHEAGELIKKELRAGDAASRFGGSEFAAFLLDANYAQGLVAAERVRSAFEQHEFGLAQPDSTEISRTPKMTISIGVAAFPDDAVDPIYLVELADSALYRATRTGQNCICAYRTSLAVTEGPLPPRRS